MSLFSFAKSEDTVVQMDTSKLNRHGLIAGATGTGKTVTLKVVAENLSKQGVPVFLADIKGDLISLAQSGVADENITKRVTDLGVEGYEAQKFPVHLWDVFGKNGTPVRTTVSEMGPMLLARMLGLNETQSGVLNIAFKIADENGWLLLDLKDLQAMLKEIGENSKDYTTDYGNVSKQSVGAIQRALLVLEQQGADQFFGEPGIDLNDFMQVDSDGKGIINVLHAKELFNSPTLYSTFLVWMLADLFQSLPEVGDLEKPKFVFFFDEAHLLFDNASDAFLQQIEQIVRLIRSKGVGIFFITQSPIDIPNNILGQLGNRIQHAIRAFSPKDLKAVKAAAETFRQNPKVDVEKAIIELKTGEALISVLDGEGQPTIVERAFVYPPESKLGVVDDLLAVQLVNQNPYEEKYREDIDRESAYEILGVKAKEKQQEKAEEEEKKQEEKEKKEQEKLQREQEKIERQKERERKNSLGYKVTKQVGNTVMRQVTNQLVRGLFNVLKGK